MTGISSKERRNSLLEHQDLFQKDRLACGKIHNALTAFGIDPSRSVIVDYFPDSGNTWILRLIDHSHRYCEFDFDSSSLNLCTLEVLGDFPRFGNKRMQIEDTIIQELLTKLENGP